MGNFQLVFYGTQESETNQHELTFFRNQTNDLFISLKGEVEECIVLDVSTAVRLSRELKRVIAEIKEANNE